MSKDDAYEYMKDAFKNVFSKPKIRRLFSSISFDEDILQLDCLLRNSIDEEYNKSFVENLFANGMIVSWLEPRYQTETEILQFFGGKEQSAYNQANHMAQLKEMLDNAKKILDKDYIRDHGYNALIINGGVL